MLSADVDECDSNPCQYNGTCRDMVNGYNCTCVKGYYGKNCSKGEFAPKKAYHIKNKQIQALTFFTFPLGRNRRMRQQPLSK